MTAPKGPAPAEQKPLAVGGMSPAGETTVVPINQPQLDAGDKKVICSAICKCQNLPGIGSDGRSLKQECVSGRLKMLDRAMDHRSPYKSEVTYDMTKRPPAPIMDRLVETKSKNLFPGWTNIIWPKDPEHPPYKAGQGYTRRPDVVIVNDATKPPTQDNIKQVVEIKFGDDKYGFQQREDYITIAGDERKMVPLKASDCDCSKAEPEPAKIPVEQLGPAAALLALLYMIVMKRPPPTGVPY